MSTTAHAPNHHGDHPGFSGLSGLVAGLSFSVGRTDDARLACELTQVEPGDRVVDVGCGPGVAARHAASLGAQVTGIDPAAVMLRLGRAFSVGSRRVTFREGRAEALPLPDGSADVLWSIATVHHWPDLAGGLVEARRVLVGGGRLLAMERRTRPGATGHASHGWTDEQAAAFADQCTDHGFADVRIERHQAGKKPVFTVTATRP